MTKAKTSVPLNITDDVTVRVETKKKRFRRRRWRAVKRAKGRDTVFTDWTRNERRSLRLAETMSETTTEATLEEFEVRKGMIDSASKQQSDSYHDGYAKGLARGREEAKEYERQLRNRIERREDPTVREDIAASLLASSVEMNNQLAAANAVNERSWERTVDNLSKELEGAFRVEGDSLVLIDDPGIVIEVGGIPHFKLTADGGLVHKGSEFDKIIHAAASTKKAREQS